jgi:hypothetical protein
MKRAECSGKMPMGVGSSRKAPLRASVMKRAGERHTSGVSEAIKRRTLGVAACFGKGCTRPQFAPNPTKAPKPQSERA